MVMCSGFNTEIAWASQRQLVVLVILCSGLFPCFDSAFAQPVNSAALELRTDSTSQGSLYDDAARAQISDTTAFSPTENKLVGLAIAETFLINIAVNRANGWVLNEPWADLDFKDLAHNLSLGWEWDTDLFSMNMFTHPFHGSLYFNAGRSNGLTYWESVPLVYLGSWTWEYLSESHRPSLNDFFITSFGGIALGEIAHRVSATKKVEVLSALLENSSLSH